MKNIEAALSNLIRPPKCNLRNYSGSFSQFINGFSKYEDNIFSFDGTRIFSSFFKNVSRSPSNKKCIIYTHSHGSSLEEGYQLLESCFLSDYSICLYDSRGSGKSQETNLTFGEQEQFDLLYVCFHLISIYNIHEFIFWGRSIGTCAVLRLAEKLQTAANQALLTPIKQLSAQLKTGINLEFHFTKFLEINKLVNENSQNFKVLGIVLDSPIKSMNDAIEQFVKSKIFNLSFLSKVASFFAEKWLKSHANVDITKDQNHELVKKTNLPCVFLISQTDEMTSFLDFKNMIYEYGKKVSKKPNVYACEIKKRHKEQRDTQSNLEAINSLSRTEFETGHCYGFTLNKQINKISVQDSLFKTSESSILPDKIPQKNSKLRGNSPLLTNLQTHSFSGLSVINSYRQSISSNVFKAPFSTNIIHLAQNQNYSNFPHVFEENKNLKSVENSFTPEFSGMTIKTPAFNTPLLKVEKLEHQKIFDAGCIFEVDKLNPQISKGFLNNFPVQKFNQFKDKISSTYVSESGRHSNYSNLSFVLQNQKETKKILRSNSFTILGDVSNDCLSGQITPLNHTSSIAIFNDISNPILCINKPPPINVNENNRQINQNQKIEGLHDFQSGKNQKINLYNSVIKPGSVLSSRILRKEVMYTQQTSEIKSILTQKSCLGENIKTGQNTTQRHVLRTENHRGTFEGGKPLGFKSMSGSNALNKNIADTIFKGNIRENSGAISYPQKNQNHLFRF